MLEPADDSGAILRAALKIGAGTIAQHQLALALRCECSTIICMGRALSAELVSLQHDAERAGAKFRFITGSRALSGLITATDELVVVTDGLLVSIQDAEAFLAGRQFVLVQSAESGIPAGFERVDNTYATAGMMRIPGRLVEQLIELPADCDVGSALTRLALQAGVAQRPLPTEIANGGSWKLIRTEAEAGAIEADWISLHLDSGAHDNFGMLLAGQLAKNFGPAVLHAGKGSNSFGSVALIAFAAALVAGWFAFTVIALLCCALAWIVARSSALLLHVERQTIVGPSRRWPRGEIVDWVIDVGIVAILTWSNQANPWESGWRRIFAPLMVVCLVRLTARIIDRKGAVWITDRSLLCLVLMIGAGAAWLPQTVIAAAVCLAFLGMLWPNRDDQQARIT